MHVCTYIPGMLLVCTHIEHGTVGTYYIILVPPVCVGQVLLPPVFCFVICSLEIYIFTIVTTSNNESHGRTRKQ
jgi:hypothetical protein